jgi:hypothetical protein
VVLHERLLTLRDEVIAHAGSAGYRVTSARLDNTPPIGLLRTGFKHDFWHIANEGVDLEDFESVCILAHRQCVYAIGCLLGQERHRE